MCVFTQNGTCTTRVPDLTAGLHTFPYEQIQMI